MKSRLTKFKLRTLLNDEYLKIHYRERILRTRELVNEARTAEGLEPFPMDEIPFPDSKYLGFQDKDVVIPKRDKLRKKMRGVANVD